MPGANSSRRQRDTGSPAHWEHMTKPILGEEKQEGRERVLTGPPFPERSALTAGIPSSPGQGGREEKAPGERRRKSPSVSSPVKEGAGPLRQEAKQKD